jgi:tellurite resistance protein TerC
MMEKPWWAWTFFFTLIFILLLLDLGLFHRKQREIHVKESLYLSFFYIIISLIFGVWVWYEFGYQAGTDYLTGYLIEKSLSIDNIFVISLIFGYFKIPKAYEHRVLFWGILGVLILRGTMIGLGTALIREFEWVLYIFGAFLIFTGIKMALLGDQEFDIHENFILKFMQKHLRFTQVFQGQRFYIIQTHEKTGKKQLFWTPLFLSLILIEFIDLIFALDSIPAIFAITTDSFIVYTSNIFAVLGLRALYFALSAIISRFYYLKYALSAILIFIGSKIFIKDLLGIEKFPSGVSLGITVFLLTLGIIVSLYKTKKS